MGIELINQDKIPVSFNILFVVKDTSSLSPDLDQLCNRIAKWKNTFASSSHQALEYLKEKKFDVVFSDMTLQDSGGVDFLNQVRMYFPYILRILFTDKETLDSSITNHNSAHQYLSKKSSAEIIINTACRALYLNRYLPDTEFKNVLNNIDSLPCLPEVYQNIMNEISSSNPSLSRISNIIEDDVLISAKIYQLMGSSYFAQFNHITSISQAVTILGIDTIQGLVLNTQVLETVDQKDFPINFQSLISHSMLIGRLAKHIAQVESLDNNSCQHAMMAGMLHDIGKVVMAKLFPQRYRMVEELIRECDITINEAEKQLFSTTHGEIGAYLLGLWGLPEKVVEAVAFHHYPWLNCTSNFNPTAAVYIADVLLSNSELDNEESLEGLNEEFLMNRNLIQRIPVWLELKHKINL